MIFSVIGLFICLYSFSHFHRGFLMFLIFRLLLGLNITLISVPSFPVIRLDMVMTVIFILLFISNYSRYSVDKSEFPLKIPFILLFVSWTISTVFAYVGLGGSFSQYIGNVSKDLILIWVIWRVVTLNDIYFIMKWLFIIFLFAGIYAIFEKMTSLNPIRDYEMSLAGSAGVDWAYSVDDIRGYRVQSIFEHAIGAGINFIIYILYVIIFIVMYKYKFRNSKIMILLCVLCALSAIFTNSRTPVVFFAISCFSFIKIWSKKTYLYLALISLLMVLIMPLIYDNLDIFRTIITPNTEESQYGSSPDLRYRQLYAAFGLFNMSPIYGLGFNYYSVMKNSFSFELIGRESMWFSILPELGLIGIIANLFLAYYCLIKLPLRYKSKEIFFIALAYWIVGSVTSVPGMKMYLYYLLIFLIIKYKKCNSEINVM